MSQLPKFVQERLRVSTSPAGHPDPDVLTAFSERSLPAHERAVVVEHLARCSECREVLALALPASEVVEDARATPHRTWLSWPTLRWGFAVAGVALVASIGVVQYQRHSQPADMAYSRNATANEAVQARQESSPADMKVALPQAQPKEAPALASKSLAVNSPPAPASRTSPSLQLLDRPLAAATGGSASGVISTEQRLPGSEARTKVAINTPPSDLPFPASASAPPARAKQAPSSDLAQQAPAQQMSEMVQVQSQAPAVTAQDQLQVQNQVQNQLQNQDQNQDQKQVDLPRAQTQRASNDAVHMYAEGERDKEMSKAKPATVPPAAKATGALTAAAPALPGLTGRSMLPLVAPTWTISSAGRLQRSFDGGKAWEDVDVGSSRLFTSQTALDVNGRLAKDNGATANKKSSEAKKEDEQAAKLQRSTASVFRAVSANGFDVWAGGAGGALYHSVDGGNQWTRVFPMANSVLLSGDIASIQFSDSQHGSLTTTASEVWTTTDAGESWQRH